MTKDRSTPERVDDQDLRPHPEMTMVSVRIPTTDLDQLRRAALATDGSVAHEIRLGVQLRLKELRDDRAVIERVKAKRDELQLLLNELQDDVEALPDPGQRDQPGVRTSST